MHFFLLQFAAHLEAVTAAAGTELAEAHNIFDQWLTHYNTAAASAWHAAGNKR